MNYREGLKGTVAEREKYLDGIRKLLDKRRVEGEKSRDKLFENWENNQEELREQFKNMLGWPLVGYEYDKSSPVKVESKLLAEEEEFDIYRMSFEVMDDLWMTGIFFKLKGEGKKPLILTVHGGSGTPEMVCGFYGWTANYTDLGQRILKHGAHVFAPQMLKWNYNESDVFYDRFRVDAELKMIGSSIAALEIFAFSRILDYFEDKDYVKNFGMAGMSYGGFYTQYTSAVETRLLASYTCSFFGNKDKTISPDWTYRDGAFTFEDAEIAALVYPRKLYISMGNRDEGFDYKDTIEQFERLKKLSERVGIDWAKLMVFDGPHEVPHSDEFIKALVDDLNKQK